MGYNTENLGLYNTNMLTDGNDTFDFQRDLNDNNDKIDSAVGKLSTLNTTTQSSLVGAINEVVSNCGALANLSTTDKTSLVNAINELLSNLDSFATKSLNNLNATGQAILDKKIEVEALLAQNGYAKFKWKENNQISKKLIICWGKYTSQTNSETFATSFTAIPSVVSQSNYNYSSAGFVGSYFAYDITTTGFSHLKYANYNFSYIAIGY